MIYLIKNDEKGYEFETELSEPLTLPEDLANQDSSLWVELREYLRETALENAKTKIGSIPCGIFDNADEIGNSIYDTCDELVHLHIDNKLTYIEVDEKQNVVKQIPLTLPSDLYSLGRDYEQFAIETGYTIISMLSEFLKKGKWICGLMRGNKIITDPTLMPQSITKDGVPSWQDADGNELMPIIWYGLDNESPIQIWSLLDNEKTFAKRTVWDYNQSHTEPVEKSDWQSFWFNGFWYMDWNALFGGFDNYYTVWMFCECGMEEPIEDFDAVRESCPIKLDENDTDEMIIQKINDFFVKLTTK